MGAFREVDKVLGALRKLEQQVNAGTLPKVGAQLIVSLGVQVGGAAGILSVQKSAAEGKLTADIIMSSPSLKYTVGTIWPLFTSVSGQAQGLLGELQNYFNPKK